MPDIATLVVRIQGDEKGATQALDTVDKKVKEAGGSGGGGGWKGILTNALSFGAGLGGLSLVTNALGFLKDNLGGIIEAGLDANRMDALLAAGLRSTHDASGQTTQSLQSLADTLSAHTGITDDAAKAAEQMLLTYTGIGKQVFPQAEQAVADMATRLNNGAIPSAQQMSQVALQLGKALNDPATGMTALRRVGVQFTAQQQEQIKNFQQHGQLAKAQAVILQELQREFGGSAAAAGKANGGLAIMNATMQNAKEKIGQALAPALADLTAKIAPLVVQVAQKLAPAITNLSEYLSKHKEVLAAVAVVIGGVLVAAFTAWAISAASAAIATLAAAAPFLLVAAGIALVAGLVIKFLPQIRELASWLGDKLKPVISAVSTELGVLHTWFEQKVLPVLQRVWGFIQANVLPILGTLAHVYIRFVQTELSVLWGLLTNVILPILGKVAGFLGPVVGLAFQGLGNDIKAVTGFIGNLFDAIGRLLGQLGNLKDTVGKVLSHLPHLPGLPSFAAGGVMGASGLAVVGEQGPELVALPGGARIYSAAQTAQIAATGHASAVAGGPMQSTFIIQLDGRTIAQSTARHLPGIVQIGTGIRHLS